MLPETDTMFEEGPSRALVAVAPIDPEWRPILQGSNQVVLYNPTSHALSIRPSTHEQLPPSALCPYCNRPLPPDSEEGDPQDRVANYFQLLEVSNETYSRPSTPPPITEASAEAGSSDGAFPAEAMAQGYFKAFFQEECRLGMGANGSVFLCQHVLDGNRLGHFAVKKIAVGESHSYLWNILREVRLLESLRHPNIITYHHSWLESCQFSAFGPKVPALHVLMQWAEGGSLDDFIDTRLGRSTYSPHLHDAEVQQREATSAPSPNSDGLRSRSARIRAFRAQQQQKKEEHPQTPKPSPFSMKAIHLLSAEEVRSLFSDVTEGLAFLHEKSILHLDLKPGNVLLTWDQGQLVPRAMLSDFGTSQDMLNSRTRSGNTGTLEYTSPESLPSPQTGLLSQVDSKSDMWSLGMILHKLLFFHLPYTYASDGDGGSAAGEGDKMERLEKEVSSYPGFKFTAEIESKFKTRKLSRNYLVLLESLLHILPSARPSCERVLGGIREGRLDPLSSSPNKNKTATSLIPISSRTKVEHPLTPLASPSHEFCERQPEVIRVPSIERPPTPNSKEKRPSVSSNSPILVASIPPLSTMGKMERKASSQEEDPRPAVWSWSLTLVKGKVVRIRLPKIVGTRSMKSSILIVKVLTISSICAEGRNLHPIATCLLLGLAVVDTWFDGLKISVVLGLFHVFIVKFGRRLCACLPA